MAVIALKEYKNGDYTNYYDTLILPSGQTIRIEFQEEWTKSKNFYSIYLVTSHKRKQADSTYGIATGKDGFTGLLWAKKKIIEFEIFKREKHANIPIIIYCTWTDNKRRDLYERGLRNLGYKYNFVFDKKALCKTI